MAWYENKDIEELVKKCEMHLSCRPDFVLARPTKQPDTDGPFDRIHRDFQFLQTFFLILADAFSKLPKIYEIMKMVAFTLIEKLRKYFLGLDYQKLQYLIMVLSLELQNL